MTDPILDVDVRLSKQGRAFEMHLVSTASSVGVTGPSGSGKTTLLRVLAGLEPKATGRVAFRGARWQDSASRRFLPPWKRRVGWVPQDATLLPHRSVRANLGWSGARPEAVRKMAGDLDIARVLDRRPRHLSGGERQRVALGRALLATPALLLLDEPFSALDHEARRLAMDVVSREAARAGSTIVLVSHSLEAVDSLTVERWEVGGDGGLSRVTGE